jgi:iron complex transport system ATP-binding protein
VEAPVTPHLEGPIGARGEPGVPVFAVEGVEFGYGGAFRLRDVSLEVGQGEILGVVGPNSAGKTTLLGLLTRVHRPARGAIRFRGVPLPRIPRRALARDVAVVPQEEPLAFQLTVEELALLGRFPRASGRLFESAEDVARAHEAMALAGVLGLRDQAVDTLAGGERQRARLARALAQEPRVLLLDEPTSHLDLRHQREMVGLLGRLNRERGLTIVFVSHDLNLAGELADRLLLLAGGRVACLGPPTEVLTEPVLEAAYGCPVWVEKLSGRVVVGPRL